MQTGEQKHLIHKLEIYRGPISALLVGFVSFGLVQAFFNAGILHLLSLLKYPPEKSQAILVDSVLGVQIISVIVSLNVGFWVDQFFDQPLSPNSSNKATKLQTVYKFVFPQRKTFGDFFFKAFLSTGVWVSLGIFLGLFVSETGLLLLRSEVQTFSITLLSFVFSSLIFFVWYYLFFNFREWVIKALAALKLSNGTLSFSVITIESMLWIPVLGFRVDTYSGLVWDLAIYFSLAVFLALLHVGPHLKEFFQRHKDNSWALQKLFLSQWALLYCLIFVFGCPLGKLSQPSLLKLFSGSVIDPYWLSSTLKASTTFEVQEFFLALLLILSSNTLPQVLVSFRRSSQKLVSRLS